jgi:hypothetical protein
MLLKRLIPIGVSLATLGLTALQADAAPAAALVTSPPHATDVQKTFFLGWGWGPSYYGYYDSPYRYRYYRPYRSYYYGYRSFGRVHRPFYSYRHGRRHMRSPH